MGEWSFSTSDRYDVVVDGLVKVGSVIHSARPSLCLALTSPGLRLIGYQLALYSDLSRMRNFD